MTMLVIFYFCAIAGRNTRVGCGMRASLRKQSLRAAIRRDNFFVIKLTVSSNFLDAECRRNIVLMNPGLRNGSGVQETGHV